MVKLLPAHVVRIVSLCFRWISPDGDTYTNGKKKKSACLYFASTLTMSTQNVGKEISTVCIEANAKYRNKTYCVCVRVCVCFTFCCQRKM